jgi:hypothetical protein
MPRLVSTTVLPPSSARSRRGSSSRRSAPSSLSTTSRIRTLMSTVYSGSRRLVQSRCAGRRPWDPVTERSVSNSGAREASRGGGRGRVRGRHRP